MKLTSIAVLLISLVSFPAVAQTQPLTAASELQLGVEAYNNIHYDEAIAHLEKAIELDPNLLNASLYLSAARAAMEMQLGVEAYNNIHYEEAIDHLQRAIESNPSLVDARLYLATTFAHQFIPGADTPNNDKLAQQAIEQYQQVIDANPSRAQKINSAKGIAYLYVNMKRFDDAKRYYRLAVDSDPNDPQLYYAIGVIDWTACYKLRTEERAKLELKPEEHLNALNDDQKKVCEDLTLKNWANIQEGIDSLNMAIQLRPDYGDAMGYLNLMYRERADVECDDLTARAQDLRTAGHWVDESLRVKKSNAEKPPNAIVQNLIETGQRYFDEGNYSEAVIQFSNAIQIDPRFAQGHAHLAQSYLKLGDTQRAYNELSRTLELTPDDYRAHLDLANLLTAARRPDGTSLPDYVSQAKPHLDFLKDKQPNNPETHQAWASYYEAQNKIGEAIQEAQQTISLDPNRAESYLLLALLQIRANQPDLAETNFKKAIAVDAKSLNAVLALGAFYQSHNRLPEAEQQFKQAIQIDPSNGVPRAALVRLLMQEGKRNEIVTFLQETKRDLPNNHQGYTMLGDYYFATGDMDKAMAEYASLYHDHPKDTQVKKNYIQILILKNQLDEAAKLNNEILKGRPGDVDGLIFKGELQRLKNDPSGAVESLQAALHNEPNNAVGHYQLGLAYAQERDLSRAESEWREAVRIRPELVDAQRALATLQISRGEYDNALQTAQQMVNAQPLSGDGYILKGIAELGLRKFADAQKDDEQARNRAPDNPAAYVQLGHVQLAQKQYGEAEKFYQQALEKDPASADGLRGLMTTYVEQKQYDKAIAAARGQIAKSPNNSNFYDLLGTALFDGKKDYAGAEVALRQAVDLDKTNSDAVEKLGKVQIQQGNMDQALALYQQAIKDNPKNARFYIHSGELYDAKQNWDQAKALYQQALVVSPDNPYAANNLAYLLLEHGGDVDVAMKLAQTARRGMPDSPNAADTLGWAYYRKGIYESAINEFQDALRLDEKNGNPDSAVVHYHLGLAYQKANRMSLAREQLAKAVKLESDYPEARKALAELGD